jgi:hypothetical protein
MANGPLQPSPEPHVVPTDDPTFVLVWPPHALTILFILIFIGIVTYMGWKALRGDACWKCGRDQGLCPHTRDEYPGGH